MKKTIASLARPLLMSWLMSLLVVAAPTMAQVPRVLGVWELDAKASKLPAGFPLASETRSYDLRDDGYLVNVVIRKYANGHPDFIQVVAKSDGKEYPQYQGAQLADFQVKGAITKSTYSETAIDEYSVNVIARYDGKVNTRGVRKIAADGKTMTIDVVAIDQNGKEQPINLVFRRVGG
ncbi:MAG TPA: hypothetical protein VMH83_00275 [Candidatus Acidoferrum sp.]|nr:hypothetical protein [Candidatus Acidoferrum sp.]